jgi:hypothetical protein
MASKSKIFQGNIVGSNANQSEMRNFTVPVFTGSTDFNDYMSRVGLFANYNGDIYHKAVSGSNPVKIMDSRTEGAMLNTSVKTITNFRINGNNLLLDVVYNNNTTATIYVDAEIFTRNTQVSGGSVNASTYEISVTESNGDVNTIPLATLIQNYINQNVVSDDSDLSSDLSKVPTREILNLAIEQNSLRQVIPYNGLRLDTIAGQDYVSLGEFTTLPNMITGAKFISGYDGTVTFGKGTIGSYGDSGEWELKSYGNPTDLYHGLLDSEFDHIINYADSSTTFSGSGVAVNPDGSYAKFFSKKYDATLPANYDTYIKNTPDFNEFMVHSVAFGNTNHNVMKQMPSDTTITKAFRYNSISDYPSIMADTNLIHKKYADDNYIKKTSGGALSLPTVTKTSNYTLTITDFTVRGNCSGGNLVFTLPDASLYVGGIFNILKADSTTNALTTVAFGSQLINGLSYRTLTTPNDSIMLQSFGTGWDII